MDRGGTPEPRDFLQLAKGFGNLANNRRARATQQKRQQYYDTRMQATRQEAARTEQSAQLANAFVSHLSQGGSPDQWDRLVPEGVDPKAVYDAKVDALSYAKKQAAFSEQNAKAKVSEYERDRREAMELVQRADMALQQGDEAQFQDLATEVYNNYVYDGDRIVKTKNTKQGRELVLEDVTGRTSRVLDDLSPDQKLELLRGQVQNPETYIKTRVAADAARHNYNSDQAKNPVPIKGTDGKTYWAIKQIDPGQRVPHTLLFDHYPTDPLKDEPISIESDGPRDYLTKQSMELENAAREGREANLPTLTKNQALSRLKDTFYKAGPMGAMESRMSHADEKFKIAQEAFEEYMAAAEKEGATIKPLAAALQATNHVDRIESQYFNALATYPDEQKKIQEKFKKDYGYLPDPADPPAGNLLSGSSNPSPGGMIQP